MTSDKLIEELDKAVRVFRIKLLSASVVASQATHAAG